ncbi:hypothetical protein H2203_002999 [Taxawa tesnikishii (nom. ined.)]|nr:hypothetical protein H2203_002999 [Dothideales sp. JES 119]
MLAFLLLALVGLAATYVVLQSRKDVKIPKGLRSVPGPKGLPVVGNTHQLEAQPQRHLQQLAREYGELFQIKIGWENWVFVNSPQAVKEILDKQSAVTSGRYPAPVLQDLVSGGMRFLLMGYTPTWRKLRAIVHNKLLTPRASEGFKPSQEFEAKQLVHDLYARNGDQKSFYTAVRRHVPKNCTLLHQKHQSLTSTRYSTSVMMTSTYGRRVPEWDCEDVREVYGLMQEFSESAAPGAFLADMIPPLAKIPVWMQWWRKRALKYQDRQTKIWMKYWTDLNKQIAEKRAPDCFVKQFIETDYKTQGISDLQGAFLAGSMIEAGSETTSSSLNSCIKYLAANPSVQARANEEISKVVGDSRSPTWDDEPNLPFVRAMIKEVLRIRPVTNIGTPHYSTGDVIYKDYFIPKGTVISIHQYAIHYDPSHYANPDAFDPSRFLGHPQKAGFYAAHPDPYARDHFDFGAGRRICPGMHLAENSLYITLSKILWAFEILPPLGDDGREEEVDVSDAAYEDGGNTLPKPFKVRFAVRNAKKEAVLRREWEEAEREGYWLGDRRVDAKGVVVECE